MAELAWEEAFAQIKQSYHLGVADSVSVAGYSARREGGAFLAMDWVYKLNRWGENIIGDKCGGIGRDSDLTMFVPFGRHAMEIIGIRSYGQVRQTQDARTNRQGAKDNPRDVVLNDTHVSVFIFYMRNEINAGKYEVH